MAAQFAPNCQQLSVRVTGWWLTACILLAPPQAALVDTPDARLVCANTGMGVAKYYGAAGPTGTDAQPPQRQAAVLDVSAITELVAPPELSADGQSLTAGAAVTLEALHDALGAQGGVSAVAAALARQLSRIATTQVRAVGSWAGNLALCAAHPTFASDLAVALSAAGASVAVVARGGGVAPWPVPIASYLKSGGEAHVLVGLTIPLQWANVGFVDKVSLRHANAHSIVNAAVFMTVEPARSRSGRTAELRVVKCTAAFGGLLQAGLYVPTTATANLVGRSLTDVTTLRTFVASLEAQALQSTLSADARHSNAYRLALLRSYAYKAVLHALHVHGLLSPRLASAVADSLAAIVDRPVSTASQSIDVSDPKLLPVTAPLPKLTAILQASGEALYTSDLSSGAGGYGGAASAASAAGAGRSLYGAFVSTPAGSIGLTLHGIQLDACSTCPGFVGLVDAADFPNQAFNDDVGDDTNTTERYLSNAARLALAWRCVCSVWLAAHTLHPTL